MLELREQPDDLYRYLAAGWPFDANSGQDDRFPEMVSVMQRLRLLTQPKEQIFINGTFTFDAETLILILARAVDNRFAACQL